MLAQRFHLRRGEFARRRRRLAFDGLRLLIRILASQAVSTSAPGLAPVTAPVSSIT